MTRMNDSPMPTRQRRAPGFHGDKCLRFTPEESWLIARTEAVHGYDPREPATTAVLASLTPPVPPARGNRLWRYLLRRLAAMLSQWAEE